jgi:APA family basic amino acid/polyamine antiporter
MGIILAVYLAVNTGFLHALSPAQVASTPALAATAMERVLGAEASRVVTVFVACSAASTVFSSLLCNPRIFFALAEEGQFFRVAARVHPAWATPWVATLAYGGLTVTYIASGGVDAAAAAGGLCLMAAGVGVHALWSRTRGWTRA